MSFLAFLAEQHKTVKTLNGSVIKRSKLGVGKDIGGEVYLHRDYESLIPDQQALKKAKTALKQKHPEFTYNVLKFSKAGAFTFFDSLDFDTADEPVAGKYVNVSPSLELKTGVTKNIWHHKWLWVKDDYGGFNVEQAFERSKEWLKLPNSDFTRIGNPEFWNKHVASKLHKNTSAA